MAFENENEIGIKPVTDYTLEELQLAYGRIHQQMEMLTLRFDMLQKIAEDKYKEMLESVTLAKEEATLAIALTKQQIIARVELLEASNMTLTDNVEEAMANGTD